MRFPALFAALTLVLPPLSAADAPPSPLSGAALYQLNCAVCHNAAGQGIPGIVPPLAKADYLMADKERSIRIVLQGLSGPIKVNGVDIITFSDDGEKIVHFKVMVRPLMRWAVRPNSDRHDPFASSTLRVPVSMMSMGVLPS